LVRFRLATPFTISPIRPGKPLAFVNSLNASLRSSTKSLSYDLSARLGSLIRSRILSFTLDAGQFEINDGCSLSRTRFPVTNAASSPRSMAAELGGTSGMCPSDSQPPMEEGRTTISPGCTSLGLSTTLLSAPPLHTSMCIGHIGSPPSLEVNAPSTSVRSESWLTVLTNGHIERRGLGDYRRKNDEMFKGGAGP